MPTTLTDFGLARLAATGSKYTRTGQALGTPAYMSPEQARGETGLTAATDVWALGCVLYELLAGRQAFEGETPAEAIGRVLTSEPADLRAIRPDVPAGLAAVVAASLSKFAGHRYPSARELGDDLARVLRGERPTRRVRRAGRPWLATAGVAVVLAGVAATLVVGAGRGGDRAPVAATTSEAETLAGRARDLRGTDPRRAAAHLHRALELAPARDDWRLERGLLCWAVGEPSEARRLWSEIRPAAPEASAARLFQGLEAYFRFIDEGRGPLDQVESRLRPIATGTGRGGRLATAVLAAKGERWTEARDALRGEDGWEVALLRGWVEERDPAGDRALAEREYTRSLEEGVDFAWTHTNRGVLRQSLGDLPGALADFDRAIALDPGAWRAWNNRGVLRRTRGDLAGAVEDFGRALEIHPRDAAVWSNRGSAREGLNDLAGAIQDFEQALALDPGCLDAWACRAEARRRLGDLAGAIADLEEAVRLDPRDARIHLNLGNARRESGDLAGAIEDYGRAVARDPRFAKAWANRASVRYARRDIAGAIEDYGRSLEIDPTLATTWKQRGQARRDRGDLTGALEDFERALALAPGDAEAWNDRGRVRSMRRDFAGAVADFDRALALESREPGPWANRALARGQLGDHAGAVADLEQALAVASPEWPHRAAAAAQLAGARAALAASGGR